jgi:hypothetical protein
MAYQTFCWMQKWYFICNLVNKEAIAKSSQSAIAATSYQHMRLTALSI